MNGWADADNIDMNTANNKNNFLFNIIIRYWKIDSLRYTYFLGPNGSNLLVGALGSK